MTSVGLGEDLGRRITGDGVDEGAVRRKRRCQAVPPRLSDRGRLDGRVGPQIIGRPDVQQNEMGVRSREQRARPRVRVVADVVGQDRHEYRVLCVVRDHVLLRGPRRGASERECHHRVSDGSYQSPDTSAVGQTGPRQ